MRKCQQLWDFMQRFEVMNMAKEAKFAQGLFGYTTYDAVQFFETVLNLERTANGRISTSIPLMRYRLYQYVIAFNHFKDEFIYLRK